VSGGIGIPFPFCEPKTEVTIVGATHLSRDKKIPKKIQKNETDPAMKGEDPPTASG
jgi:hypothetical protein